VNDHLKDAAYGITGAGDLFDLFLHACFGGGIHATETSRRGGNGGDLFPCGGTVEFHVAYADDVAGNFNAQGTQQQLGQCSAAHARRTRGRGALKNVAGVGEVCT